MEKEEFIRRYGEDAYAKLLEQRRIYHKVHKEEENARNNKYNEEHPEQVKTYKKRYYEAHLEEEKVRNKKYRERHPEEIRIRSQEQCRKRGKRYERNLKYKQTGLQGDKNKIRMKHGKQYKPYKEIIAPESQIHHEWVPETADYRGVALVEADQHMHGFVDVIEILGGKITLLTEKEVADVETKSYV